MPNTPKSTASIVCLLAIALLAPQVLAQDERGTIKGILVDDERIGLCGERFFTSLTLNSKSRLISKEPFHSPSRQVSTKVWPSRDPRMAEFTPSKPSWLSARVSKTIWGRLEFRWESLLPPSRL